MLTEIEIEHKYPLHYLVWKNDFNKLERLLEENQQKQQQSQENVEDSSSSSSSSSSLLDIEQLDHRHRTPLMLAASLDHKECIRILLKFNAMVNVIDHSGFNILHETVTTADPKLIRDVFEQKDRQFFQSRMIGLKDVIRNMVKDSNDFYLEMKWEFTSWLPFISQFCPNDTYKIYKSGSKLRVDSTLCGLFNNEKWSRGQFSWILIGDDLFDPKQYNNNREVMIKLWEIDHGEKQIYKREKKFGLTETDLSLLNGNNVYDQIQITDEDVYDRLIRPIKTSYIETDKINFKPQKSGIYGFRTDRIETLNGYRCKVYNAQNVGWISKTRIEHLTEEDKQEYHRKRSKEYLAPFLGITKHVMINPFDPEPVPLEHRRNPYQLSMVDYFNLQENDERDIGSLRETTIMKQNFKANIWMCEEFPMNFKEQILPIVNILANSSTHFNKLKNFINGTLPSGFPVKIEIPFFHLISANISFLNVFALDETVDGVRYIPDSEQTNDQQQEQDGNNLEQKFIKGKCVIDEKCFTLPENYEISYKKFNIIDFINDGNDGQFDDEDVNHIAHNNRTANDEEDLIMKQLMQNNSGESGNILHLFNNQNNQSENKQQQTSSSSPQSEQKLSIMEALSYDSEKDLQKAIQLSLIEYQKTQEKETLNNATNKTNNKAADEDSSSISSYESCDSNNDADADVDADNNLNKRSTKQKTENNDEDDEEKLIKLTLEQSKHDYNEMIRKREQEDEENLQKCIQLSLLDK